MIDAKTLFPDPNDRAYIKSAIDLFNGVLIKVTEKDSNSVEKIIYSNQQSY